MVQLKSIKKNLKKSEGEGETSALSNVEAKEQTQEQVCELTLESEEPTKLTLDSDEHGTLVLDSEGPKKPVVDSEHKTPVVESGEHKKPTFPVCIPITTCSSPIEFGMDFPPSPMRDLLFPKSNNLVSPKKEGPLVTPKKQRSLVFQNNQNTPNVVEQKMVFNQNAPNVVDQKTVLNQNAPNVVEQPTVCTQNAPIVVDQETVCNGRSTEPIVVDQGTVCSGQSTEPIVVDQETVCNGQSTEPIVEDLPKQEESTTEPLVLAEDKHPALGDTPSAPSPATPRKQKPPVSPNKPKLSLIVPPLPSASSFEVERTQVVNDNVTNEPMAPTHTKDTTPDAAATLLFDVAGGQCFTLLQDDVEDTDSGSSTPLLPTQRRESVSSEVSSEGLCSGPHLQDLLIQEQDLGLSDERNTSDEDDQTASSTTGSTGSREDDQGEWK